MAENAGVVLEEFVAAFIDFPKPLAAVVNGPAFGIGKGFCDVSISSWYLVNTTVYVIRQVMVSLRISITLDGLPMGQSHMSYESIDSCQ